MTGKSFLYGQTWKWVLHDFWCQVAIAALLYAVEYEGVGVDGDIPTLFQ